MQGNRLTDSQKKILKEAIDKAETFSQLIEAMLAAGLAIRNNSNNKPRFDM